MDITKLFDVSGKSALVTGASGGIGYMIAEGLVRAGVHVTICSRKAKDIEAAAKALSAFGKVTGIAADLASPDGIKKVGEAINAAGKLHILVNNAGTTWGAPIAEFPRAGFEKVLNLNLLAPFEMTKAVLPALKAAASKEDPARVINISSVDGTKIPIWESYPYSATKAGLNHMGRHLGKNLASENITVNTIAPGFFQSKMTSTVIDFEDEAQMAAAASPLGQRTGTTEDIVGATIYLASRAGAWLSGVTIPVSGGVSTIQ
jgi:NAD(P)-dependent dehydrogenase (short-subunit alcohol dehydrogenase family)